MKKFPTSPAPRALPKPPDQKPESAEDQRRRFRSRDMPRLCGPARLSPMRPRDPAFHFGAGWGRR